MFPKTKEAFIERMLNMRRFAGFLEKPGPPTLIKNEEGRLHSDTQPAYRSATRIIWYRDGRRHGLDADIFGSVTYYWNGVLIPDHFFLNRTTISLDEILLHPNAEVRAVGIQLYGYERLDKEERVKILDRDVKKGSKLMKFTSDKLHEPLVIVQVTNSTAEPDGTYKPYYLCVPPTMKTCKAAIAWTFNKSPDDYHPSIET